MVQGTVSSAGLPAPWQEVHAEGLTYYWNTETNVTQYDKPVAGQAKGPDYSYLGGAQFSQFGADDSNGGLDYNAPPPDAYNKSGGMEITKINYGTTADGESYRKHHEISVKCPPGMIVPDPMQTFVENVWPPSLMEAIRVAGYKAPTPIQAQSW